MDLPLTVLVICAICAAFSKYLEGEGCKCSAAAAGATCVNGGGSLAQLPVYVPEGFPCGRSTLHQTAWLLKHPSSAFLLSAYPTHRRCWMLVTGVLTQFIWLLRCILVCAASPSASADYGIRLRSAFLPLIRIVPEAMALAQLAWQGPMPTVIYLYTPVIYTQLNLVAALLHVITTSIGSSRHTGLLDLPVFLALSLVELLLSLTIRYLLSMHGHAAWTATIVATTTSTSLGVPLLLAACMSGWESSCRGQRRRLNGEDSCDVGVRMAAAGQGATAASAVAAKVEGQVTSLPSQCSAGSSGEASGAGHLKQRQQHTLGQLFNCKALVEGQTSGGKAPGGKGTSEVGRRINSVAVADENLEAAAAAAASCPSSGSSGEADEQQQQQQQMENAPATIRVNRSVTGRSGRTDGGVTATGGGGAGDRIAAALAGASLLGAAAAAVAANNRARDANGGAAPFDDPEKWASVILIRQILAQPMAEWQPMFMRQRASIKVWAHAHAFDQDRPMLTHRIVLGCSRSTLPSFFCTSFDACPCALRSPGMSRSSCPPTGGLQYRRFGICPRHRALSSMSASEGEIGRTLVPGGCGDGLSIEWWF